MAKFHCSLLSVRSVKFILLFPFLDKCCWQRMKLRVKAVLPSETDLYGHPNELLISRENSILRCENLR